MPVRSRSTRRLTSGSSTSASSAAPPRRATSLSRTSCEVERGPGEDAAPARRASVSTMPSRLSWSCSGARRRQVAVQEARRRGRRGRSCAARAAPRRRPARCRRPAPSTASRGRAAPASGRWRRAGPCRPTRRRTTPPAPRRRRGEAVHVDHAACPPRSRGERRLQTACPVPATPRCRGTDDRDRRARRPRADPATVRLRRRSARVGWAVRTRSDATPAAGRRRHRPGNVSNSRSRSTRNCSASNTSCDLGAVELLALGVGQPHRQRDVADQLGQRPVGLDLADVRAQRLAHLARAPRRRVADQLAEVAVLADPLGRGLLPHARDADGRLSLGSPRRAAKSGYCAGVRPYFSTDGGRGHPGQVGDPLARVEHRDVSSLTSWKASRSPVMISVSKPSAPACLASVAMMSSAS